MFRGHCNKAIHQRNGMQEVLVAQTERLFVILYSDNTFL